MYAAHKRPAPALRPVFSSSLSSCHNSYSRKGVKKPPKWKQRTPKPLTTPLKLKHLLHPHTLPASLKTPSYPSDSYYDKDDGDYDDDIIIVNSVELGPSMRSIGVEHYLEQVAKLDSDDFTPPSSADYRRSRSAIPSLSGHSDSDSGEEEEEAGLENKKPRGWPGGDEGIDYSDVPAPTPSTAEYQREIYKATTTNPAVFLAIIRIAEKNMPFINFDSALSHLPNLRPKDALPKLRQGVMHTQQKERYGDLDMCVIFLPHFYQDGRHALGYYTLSPEPDNWSWTPKQGHLFVKHEFFTPCTTQDLEMYNLVNYVKGLDDTTSSGGHGLSVDCMNSVGARGGTWLAWDVVEDWEYWVSEYGVVRSVWERDLALTRGVEETEMVELARMTTRGR